MSVEQRRALTVRLSLLQYVICAMFAALGMEVHFCGELELR